MADDESSSLPPPPHDELTPTTLLRSTTLAHDKASQGGLLSPCHAWRTPLVCDAHPGCAWCLTDCFEQSLWRCPRRPKCTRPEPEFRGVATGVPTPEVFFGVLALAALVLFSFAWWWGMHPGYGWFRREPSRKVVSVVSDSVPRQPPQTTTSSSSVETPLLETDTDAITALAEEAPRERRRVVVLKALTTLVVLPLFLAGCFAVLASFPAPPVLNICDLRIDVLENARPWRAPDGKIRAELLLSIYNPNRFAVAVEHAKGKVRFQGGALFDLEWSSVPGHMDTIAEGSVWDARVVATLDVDHNPAIEVGQLIADLFGPHGLEMFLDLRALVSLRFMGTTLLSRVNVALNSLYLDLEKSDTSLCACEPLPLDGVFSFRA